MSVHSFTDATSAEQCIFLLFMLLWIVYSLLNQFNSIHDIRFDPTTLVWCQEVLKIVLSLGLYFVQDGGPRRLVTDAAENCLGNALICWYGIPAGLYAMGDVLTYINLRAFDPATLHLLGELKLVLTAVVYQVLFGRRLNKWHCTSLVIITLGCITKTLDSMELSSAWTTADVDNTGDGGKGVNSRRIRLLVQDDDADNSRALPPHPTAGNYFLIAVHIVISTVAGVYNEKLLKDKPSISINLHNICLYLDGMLLLTLGMLCGLSEHTSITNALSPSSLRALFAQPSILAMACTMSLAGIVTSRFLKVFDSIRKSVAVALVVVSLPLLSRSFFGTPITPKMIVSILMVVLGMCIYTSQPSPKSVGVDEGEGQNEVEANEQDEAELFLPAISIPFREDQGGRARKYSGVSQTLPIVLQEREKRETMQGKVGIELMSSAFDN